MKSKLKPKVKAWMKKTGASAAQITAAHARCAKHGSAMIIFFNIRNESI